MKAIKSAFINILQPKLLIFAASLFNLIYISSKAFQWNRGTGGPSFPAFSMWYEKDTFIHVPMIFAAACLLFISKKWSYLSAVFLSGYIVIYGLNYFINRPFTFAEEWNWIRANETDLLLEWNMQFAFAVTILVFSIFYLVQKIKAEKLFQ